MRYGRFDEAHREYVITRPDTPVPWMNYLHNDEYCALISNNGGGYSFHLTARDKRILRYRLNNVPMDRPGRYLYLRNDADGDFWSATWQPVLKDLEEYETETRHGFGYTRVLSAYRGIETDLLYVVPVEENCEYWRLRVTNRSGKPVRLTVFSYAEFCLFQALNDMSNFQYTYNIARAYAKDNIIHHTTQLHGGNYVFFTTDRKWSSFDCDREVFLGRYHSEADPEAVRKGKCFGSTADGGNPIAATAVPLALKAGESKAVTYLLGVAPDISSGRRLIRRALSPGRVEQVMKELAAHWERKIGAFQVKTPDNDVNLSLNQWNAYQTHTTFSMSRGPSIYEGGIGRGMGFRDSNQDTLGVVHSVPEKVKNLLRALARNMFQDGTAYHQFFRLTGEGDGKGYSDDALWIILSTAAYLKETGDFKFLQENIDWADGGKGSLFEHLEAALRYTYHNVGTHRIPCMGVADWNDTLHINGPRPGESVWVAQFLVKCAKEFARMAEAARKPRAAALALKMAVDMSHRINRTAWDGAWYHRAYDGWGGVIGSKRCKEGKIYLNTQSWAVFSGVADQRRGISAMDAVAKFLDSEHGIALLYPGYRRYSPRLGGISTFPPGLKENGGIFCHANTWAIIAECLLGRGDRAFKYYRQLLPPVRDRVQSIHQAEPYVYAQVIASREHRDFGLARNSWLTGTASWMYVAGTQYLLGIQPDYDGLRVQPCLPEHWNGFEAVRRYRGTEYRIQVKKKGSGAKREIRVNGKVLSGDRIPILKKKTCDVQVLLGV